MGSRLRAMLPSGCSAATPVVTDRIWLSTARASRGVGRQAFDRTNARLGGRSEARGQEIAQLLFAGAQDGIILPFERGQERVKLAGIAASRDAFKGGAAAFGVGIRQLELHQCRADDTPHTAVGAQLAETVRRSRCLFARINVAQRGVSPASFAK